MQKPRLDTPERTRELADRLIDLGTKVRVLAIAVEGLGRKQDRAQDGLAISAMLVQLGDEIADVTEMVVSSISATENWDN